MKGTRCSSSISSGLVTLQPVKKFLYSLSLTALHGFDTVALDSTVVLIFLDFVIFCLTR